MARWRPLTDNEKRQLKMKAQHAVSGIEGKGSKARKKRALSRNTNREEK